MLCPICAGEFQFKLAHCPSCGCGLVASTLRDQAVSEAKSARRKHIEFAELCRPRGYPIAMLIKQMLEQNGVTVIVQGGNALSVLPHLAFGGELRVMVDSVQLEFAIALYRAYFESDEGTEFIADE